MKRLFVFTFSLMLLAIWSGSSSAVDIKGKKTDAFIAIETDMYRLEWKTARQAGYISAFVKKGKDELLLFEGAATGRRLYHSANYASWKDWGHLDDIQILENQGGVAKVEFTMNDGLNKDYICTVTFVDGSPLIKHDVKVKAKGKVSSFSDGHEPMYEVRSPIKGRAKWDSQGANGPWAYCAFWTKDAFSALYATDPAVEARSHDAWEADGRMDLVHNALGKQLSKGDISDPIVYWVAFGEGGEKEAKSLADEVAKLGQDDVKPQAVDAYGKLSTTWADIKSIP
jgi:hypothetical protein